MPVDSSVRQCPAHDERAPRHQDSPLRVSRLTSTPPSPNDPAEAEALATRLLRRRTRRKTPCSRARTSQTCSTVSSTTGRSVCAPPHRSDASLGHRAPHCVQKCAHLPLTAIAPPDTMTLQSAASSSRGSTWARTRRLEVRFVASEGPGSHGTLYVIARRPSRTTGRRSARDCKMLADLDIDRDDF